MQDEQQMLRAAQAALERRPEINLHRYPIALAVEDGVLVVRGKVESIVAKRLARRELVALFGVERVVEQLHLSPAEPRGDSAIADALQGALMQERALRDYRISARALAAEPVSNSHTGEAAASGEVGAQVRDAVVVLAGTVTSLTHKRLVDVLAWWTPGVSAVENHLHVQPPEQDSDAEINDALRMVLEKDPWLDAGQIAVHVENRHVTLEGLVPGDEQRSMATQDAWYVLGVHGVDNRLRVRLSGDA